MFAWIKRMICKRKGHEFKFSHIEPDGWGNEWHWKHCKRCKYSTFDSKEIY